MAEAAAIGANMSNYTGNSGLGGGVIEAVKIDTKPLEQLAQYTMLYNKAEYDQRQKDAEALAQEIADATKYDLTSSIPKDAKIIQDKYNKLQEYLRNNPDAVNYRNTEKWQEYKQLRNDLEQDIAGAKTRSVMNMLRREKISQEKNPDLKRIMEEELDRDIENTDIRTTIPHEQQYDIRMPEMPKGAAMEFDVFKKGPNQDYKRDYDFFNVSKARQDANLYAIGLDETVRSSRKIIKQTTDERGLTSVVYEEGGTQKSFDFLSKEEFDREFNSSEGSSKRTAAALKNNFWVQGAEVLNSAVNDPAYQTEGRVDKNKLKGVSKDVVALIERTNEYLVTKTNEIKSGIYRDDMGKTVTFGSGFLKEEDYQPINWEDGITPEELAFVAAYSSWQGDKYSTQAIQTNDQLEADRLAQARWETIYNQSNANYRHNNPGGAVTVEEISNVVDYTQADPSQLTIADFASINPNWVEVKDGVLKLTPTGIRESQTVKINSSDGSVTYKVTDYDGQATDVNVPKSKYQKNAVTVTQTVLKERAGQSGNPFTYRPPQQQESTNANQSQPPKLSGESDAQYYRRTGKVYIKQ